MRSPSDKAIMVLFAVLGLLHGFLYAVIIYPWQAPDENWHFEYARLVYESGPWKAQPARSPEILSQLLDSMEKYRFWELIPWATKGQASGGLLYQPPLYYWLGALTLHLIPGSDIVTQLYALRLFSVLLGTVTVLLTYLTVRALFPEEPFLQIATPAFVLLLPMHTYMTSSVNNDNLAEVIAALAIYFLTLSFQKGLSLVRAAGIALSLVLGLYTKRTTFFLVPLTLFAIPIILWIRPPRLARWQKAAGLALPGAILVATTIFWREGSLSRWWAQLYRHLAYTGSYPNLLSMMQILPERISSYTEFLFKSFWAYFGWLTIELRPPWYTVILIFCLVILLGLARFGFRAMQGSVQLVAWQKAVLLLYVLSVLLIVSLTVATFLLYETDAVFATSARGAQPHSRYLFPAIVPIAILFALGFRELVPRACRLPALFSYLVVLFAFDWFVLGKYIIPYFYNGLL